MLLFSPQKQLPLLFSKRMNAVDALLFVVFFALFWCAVNFVSSILSGWSSLRNIYSTPIQSGKIISKRNFASVSFGNSPFLTRFTYSMNVRVYSNGICLQPISIFRMFKPLLTIPWESIYDAQKSESFIFSFNFRVKGAWPKIFIYENIGRIVAEQYAVRNDP